MFALSLPSMCCHQQCPPSIDFFHLHLPPPSPICRCTSFQSQPPRVQQNNLFCCKRDIHECHASLRLNIVSSLNCNDSTQAKHLGHLKVFHTPNKCKATSSSRSGIKQEGFNLSIASNHHSSRTKWLTTAQHSLH